jgi:hypothetical protein
VDSAICGVLNDVLSVVCTGSEATSVAFGLACAAAAVRFPQFQTLCNSGVEAFGRICAIVEVGGTPDVAAKFCEFLFDPVVGSYVSGTVRDSLTRAPLSGASVTIGLAATVFTDQNGYYVTPLAREEFTSTYRVTVAANGYSTEVSSITMSPDVHFGTFDAALTKSVPVLPACTHFKGDIAVKGLLTHRGENFTCPYSISWVFHGVEIDLAGETAKVYTPSFPLTEVPARYDYRQTLLSGFCTGQNIEAAPYSYNPPAVLARGNDEYSGKVDRGDISVEMRLGLFSGKATGTYGAQLSVAPSPGRTWGDAHFEGTFSMPSACPQ